MSVDIQARLDRLESLIDQHQETIDRQQARIEQQEQRIQGQEETIAAQREQIERLQARQPARAVVADGGDVKVLGEFDIDGGTGVLGRATGDGETHGVRGEATSADGYGLYTPDDASVAGVLETGALAGAVTGGEQLDSLIGTGLVLIDGELRLEAVAPHPQEPGDLQAVLDEMDGAGTEADPYIITTDHELQAMNADLTAFYKLGENVDASLTGKWYGGDGFDPVGDDETPFEGNFDGNGHVVEGLTINRADRSYVGMFGYADSDATIESVGLEDADVTGYFYVGGVAGELSSGTVTGSHVTGTVTGEGNYVGGIVGEHGGTLSECFSTGQVTGGIVGGLVGRNYSDVQQSYTTSSIEGSIRGGGVAGEGGSGAATVSECFATGSVAAGSDFAGLVGENNGDVGTSYWDTETTGQTGGIGTDNGTSDVTGLATQDMTGDSVNLDFANDFGLGGDDGIWQTVSADDGDSEGDDYPVLNAIDRPTQLDFRS